MKNLNKILIAFLGVIAISCTDEVQENKVAVTTKSTPELLSPTSDFSMVLSKVNADLLATTVIWNDAKYDGTQTVVTYAIEFAASGTDFATPVTVATTSDRFKSFTVGELNSAALDSGFAPFVESEIEVRIKSFVGTTQEDVTQYSNSYKIRLTPYPSWPNWGIIGSATPTGWDSDTNMDYSLSTRLYSITIVLTQAEFKFRLDDQWTTNLGDNGNDLSLEANGGNIPVPSAGTYKIVANFSDAEIGGMAPKTYTATKQ